MQEFDPCCPPCTFAVQSFLAIPDPVKVQKKANKCRPKPVKNKDVCDFKIWPPLEARGAFPRYEDAPKICYCDPNSPHKKVSKPKKTKLKTICEDTVAVSSRILHIPPPTSKHVNNVIPRYKSPELIGPTVTPHRPSHSSLPWPDYPEEPSLPDLELHKPKSGIIIRGSVETTLADLISLGYDRPYAIDLIKKYGNFDYLSLGFEGEEMSPEDLYNLIENLEEESEGENVDLEIEVETDESKKHDDKKPISEYDYSIEPNEMITKWVQKFRRESDANQSRPDEISFKRKTLQSHSFSNIKQTVVKEYKYGIQLGNYDQGDVHFSMRTKNKQTLANLIVAYCFSFIKHPCQWSSQDIDDILEAGNQLYSNTLDLIQQHGDIEVTTLNLLTNIEVRNKRFIYRISEPVITGLTKSEDKTVYNLTKGLSIFFKQYNCALLQTIGLKLIIWKRKFYFLFDPTSRAKDLFPDSFGAAAIVSFYDIKTIVSMLLERTVMDNWPFTLCNVCVTKIVDPDCVIPGDSNKYQILSASKAVINATISMADPCFDWASNKQSLPISIIALIYSKITPSAAWSSKLVDKIIILGNIFYCEIAISDNTDNITMTNIPSGFTLGPYKAQILILSNVVKGLIFSQDESLSLDMGLDKFFEHCTMGIVQFDRDTYYAIWKQRDYYYMFDSYPTNFQGVRKWNGTGILSMHNSIDSLKATLKININKMDNYEFIIHALKDVKVCLGGDELRPTKLEGPLARFKHMNLSISQIKPICIDPTTTAIEVFSPNTIPSESDISVSSSVFSIDDMYIPRMLHKHKIPSYLPDHNLSKKSLNICDLNSPSLSNTQLEPLRPTSVTSDDKFSEISDDVHSMSTLFDLLVPPEDQSFSGDLYIEMLDIEKKMLDELDMWCGEDYYGMEETQLEVEVTVPKTSSAATMTNRLEILNKRILHPLRLPQRPCIDRQIAAQATVVEKIPDVTLSEELRKETNFIPVPDGSEIINGTDTIINYEDKNISLLAPFIAIMAVIVSHKYSINSWDASILDYIIFCGNALQETCPFIFHETTVHEFRRIVLGSTDYSVKSTYILDSVCKSKIIEQILNTLFRRCTTAVIVTPNYSCAVFYKNHLYYLFDAYNANSVGLGQAGNAPGFCFFARFSSCHQMVARILYNKFKREINIGYETTRFVLCVVEVHQIPKGDENAVEEPAKEKDQEKSIRVKEPVKETPIEQPPAIGYLFKEKPPRWVICGEDSLTPQTAGGNKIKECHFVALSAMLLLFYHPIKTWSSTIVDQALKLGREIFIYAKNRGYHQKRIINNLYLENQFLDVIITQLELPVTIDPDISTLLDYYLRKRSFLMLQFPLKCMALFIDKKYHHLFDPYKLKKENARWIRFESREKLITYLKAHVCNPQRCVFYSFCITRIRNTKEKLTLTSIMSKYKMKKQKYKENIQLDKPFFEKEEWLDVDPVPWNRIEIVNHVGDMRGKPSAMWKEWDIEFPNDLWSLWGNLHQKSSYFHKQARGKQTLCNCVVCIVIVTIYDFTEWNPILLDSILKAGNQYYIHCVREMSDKDEKDTEFNMENLKTEVQIPPFTATITCKPIVEGTMYIVLPFQFNLYKALAFFFDNTDKRFGIIIVSHAQRRRILAFGKVQEKEYFMYDCESYGAPLFLDKQGCSYILRTDSFHRLLFIMAVTLREGNFYIYEVTVDLQDDMNAKENE